MDMSLKKLILAGIGSAAYTYEKSMTIIDELVKKGELTVNQGKELGDELKRKLQSSPSGKIREDFLPVDKLKEALSALNLATKQDLDEIKDRISRLENK